MEVTAAVVVCLLLCATDLVRGHGRLVDPPSRSTMWRYGFKNPPNYNDNALYCGGVKVQYEENSGKCGVCGDPWQGPHDNEPGGRYANGIIVRKYEVGDVIESVVELTASHKGYFEFKLCPTDDPTMKVNQSCFDRHVLRIAGTNRFRYSIPAVVGGQMLRVKLQLPARLKCKYCVFQWKYNAGNSWGTDPVTNRGCVGCGNQEQFYGCADIAIGYDVNISPHKPLPADTPAEEDDKKPIVHEENEMYHGDHQPEPADDKLSDQDGYSQFDRFAPPVPSWTLMEEEEKKERIEELEKIFPGQSASITESETFKFISENSGKGMTPCMCVCKNNPVSLRGGFEGALDLKVFQSGDDRLVCMCMCQSASSSLRAVPAVYILSVLVVILANFASSKR